MTTAVVSPTPSAALISAEGFARRYSGRHVELVDGVVVELPVPHQKHGKVCNWAAFYLTQFAVAEDLGHVTTNDSFVRLGVDPDRVRGADVCFFSYDRLPRGELPEGLVAVTPDVVVEVRSPSDGWNSVLIKVGEYLTAGVRVVIVLDITTRSASVYRAESRQQIFDADEDLSIADVLPGFAVRVEKLFA